MSTHTSAPGPASAPLYGIVGQSGGHTQVHSVLGHRTRFEIFLPVYDGPRNSDAPKVEAPSEFPGPQATILLADDEPALRQAVAEVLRQSGYTVLEAPFALEALELAASRLDKIDFLLTDIVMPGLRGTELAARIRAARPDIKVIYMSGYVEGISETQLPDDAQYLQKPFRFATLLNLLGSSLRKT